MIDPRRVPSIGPLEAHERLASPADETREPILLDVREPDEFFRVRAPGCVLLPLSQFVAEYEALPRDRPILVLCNSGNRSLNATAFLLAKGWRDVTNVSGGIIAWERAGLEVRRGPVEPGEGELRA